MNMLPRRVPIHRCEAARCMHALYIHAASILHQDHVALFLVHFAMQIVLVYSIINTIWLWHFYQETRSILLDLSKLPLRCHHFNAFPWFKGMYCYCLKRIRSVSSQTSIQNETFSNFCKSVSCTCDTISILLRLGCIKTSIHRKKQQQRTHTKDA